LWPGLPSDMRGMVRTNITRSTLTVPTVGSAQRSLCLTSSCRAIVQKGLILVIEFAPPAVASSSRNTTAPQPPATRLTCQRRGAKVSFGISVCQPRTAVKLDVLCHAAWGPVLNRLPLSARRRSILFVRRRRLSHHLAKEYFNREHILTENRFCFL